MSASASMLATFRPSDSSSSASAPSHRIDMEPLPEYTFVQVYLIPLKDGTVVRREIPIKLIGPEADMATTSEDSLKKTLSGESGKTVAHLDIYNLTVTYAGGDGKPEKLEYNDFVKTLRNLYDAVLRKNERSVSWPDYRERSRGNSNGEPFLLPPTLRTLTMSQWDKTKVVEKLSKQMPQTPERIDRCEKMEKVVERISSAIEDALSTPGISDERKKKLEKLKAHVESHDSFALYSAAYFDGEKIDEVLEALKKAVENEKGDPKEGVAGQFFGRRDTVPTFEEESYLRDIALLGPKERPEFIAASQKLGRPVTRDGIVSVLTGVFAAKSSNITESEINAFFAHPMIADIELDQADKDKIGEALKGSPSGGGSTPTPPASVPTRGARRPKRRRNIPPPPLTTASGSTPAHSTSATVI